ncbi:hypothetical protein D3C78_609510 [compost metagenome]
MLGFTLEDGRLAGAAHAFAAQALDLGGFGLLDGLQDGHAFFHLQLHTRLRQHHGKGTAGDRSGGKLFPMHAVLGNAGLGGAGDDRVDQWFGAAYVQVRLLVQARAQGGQVELAVEAVDVETSVGGVRAVGQLVLERPVLRRAEGIVKFVVGTGAFQFMQLRQERGNADAAGNQHMAAGGRIQGEQVVGRGNGQAGAHFHLLVHERRAALGLLLQAHANLVAAGVARVAHQRVGVAELAAVGAVHLHDDVAATGEGGHRRAVFAGQGKALDQRRGLFHCGNVHAEHFICVGHGSPRLPGCAAGPAAHLYVQKTWSGCHQSSRWATAIRLWKWAMPCSLMPLRSRSAMIRPWPR